MTGSEIMYFLVALLIMMNPLGSLSIFLDLTKWDSVDDQRKIAKTTGVAIIILMLITVWTGEVILNALGITIASFRVAGGIILLLMGLSMLQSRESPVSHTPEDNDAAKKRQSIAVVPMALPVIIGPGSISTIIITTGEATTTIMARVVLSGVCIFLGVGMALMLYFANPVAKLVGPSVIKVLTRIMGMLIMAIAAGMLAEGLLELFPGLQ